MHRHPKTEKPKRKTTPTKRARKTKLDVSSLEDENDDVFAIEISRLTDGSDVDTTTSTNNMKRKKADSNNHVARKVLMLSYKNN